MRESDFKIFLESELSIVSKAAIARRILHGKEAEKLLGMSLDLVVSDDDIMYDALKQINLLISSAHNQIPNAVRKYYKFVNGKEFPRLKAYHSHKHP